MLMNSGDLAGQSVEELLLKVHAVSDSVAMNAVVPVDRGELIYNVDAAMIHVWTGAEWLSLEALTSLRSLSSEGELLYYKEDLSVDTVLLISKDANNKIELGSDNGLVVRSGQGVYHGMFVLNANGILTIGGVPFRPSQVSFTAFSNVDALNLNSDNGVGNNNTGFRNAFGYMQGFARANADGSITQQVIYGGGSGNSINDISRYASSSHCIGLRYSNQNGDDIGRIRARLQSFTSNGFQLVVAPPRIANVVVMYVAYE